MTTKRWDFRDEDLRRYTVELEHGFWSGKRVITVNGREVVREKKMFGFDPGSEHGFEIDGHAALLRIRSQGVGYAYELYVDGNATAPQGTTITRPAPGTATPMAPPDTALPIPGMTMVNARPELEQRVRNGGRWFYWIAGLSAVNFVFFFMGSSTGFALGTTIDWILQGIIEELADPSMSWIGHVAVIALFVFLGTRATAGAQWAFIVGGLVYAVDGLILLLVGDWIGIVVHGIALFAIVSAIVSLRKLRAIPPATTLPAS
jgi:FAIM1 (Fas apoptotic inhibitory molecule) protein